MLFFSENVSENKYKECQTKANKKEHRRCNQFYGMHVFIVKSEFVSEI